MTRIDIDFQPRQRDRIKQYAETHGLRLSRAYADLLDSGLAAEQEPTDEELANAYRDAAEEGKRINKEWQHVSQEANQYLGEPPEIDADPIETSDNPIEERRD